MRNYWEFEEKTYGNGVMVKIFNRFCKVSRGICCHATTNDGFEIIRELMLHGF